MSGLMQSALLGVAIKSTAVLGAAWLLNIFLRGRSPALRHVVWTAAATAVLVLPFLSVSLPVLRVPAPGLLPPSTLAAFDATGSDRLVSASAAPVAKAGAPGPRQPAAHPV